MVDYRKYIQVLEILKAGIKRDLTGWSSIWDFSDCTDEQKASAICDLFDTKTVATPFTYWKNIPLDLNRVTCNTLDDLTATQCQNTQKNT